ncbi:hypothetical protein C8J56DRAFT_895468 [Mycena floridula]|nr:hypothetical protein C8J56DRAFT_895468 [Mycena floridula]
MSTARNRRRKTLNRRSASSITTTISGRFVTSSKILSSFAQSVVNQALEVSFGSRAKGPVTFQSRGPALEAVVDVLRDSINGVNGENIILTKWVDDLTAAATQAIEKSGEKPSRQGKLTAGMRLIVEEEVVANADKRRKLNDKGKRKAAAAVTQQAKKLAAQGQVNHPFYDLTDEEPDQPAATKDKRKRGRATDPLLDWLTIRCRTKSTNEEHWRCSADGCHESWASPNDLRLKAQDGNDDASLGSQVAKNEAPGTSKDPFATFKVVGAQKQAETLKAYQKKTNLLMMRFICDACLPPFVADKKTFLELASHLDPQTRVVFAHRGRR